MKRVALGLVLTLLAACGGEAATTTTTAPATTTTGPVTTSGPATTTTLPDGIEAIIPVATGPIVLAATADAVWVEAHRADMPVRIDPAQNLETHQLTDVKNHCMIVAGAGFVWTTHFLLGRVTKIDPATAAAVDTISMLGACGISVTDAGVYVSSPALGSVIRYDPITLEEIEELPVAGEVLATTDALWVLGGWEEGEGTLWQVDPATNQVVASTPLPGVTDFSVGMVFAFDSLWVASRTPAVIYRIDAATNQLVATIAMDSEVGGLGAGADSMWASDFGNGAIHRIDPATNTVTSSLTTRYGNLGPPLEAFGSLWVAALDANAVLRIDLGAFGG